MKIQYGELILGDAGEPAISDFQINGARLVQEDPIISAVEQAIFARGNHKSEIGFVAARKHGSVDEAQEFVAFHEADLLDSADLIITSSSGTRILRFPSAKLETSRGRYLGVTSYYNYSFKAGRPAKGTV